MSIEVDDLLKLAEHLSAGSQQCEWRAGASRAYYAAYHKALIVADQCLPSNPQVCGEHVRLTERLKAGGMKGRSLAYSLIELKRVRTDADYRLAEPFTQCQATDLLANCRAFVPRADAFRAHVERAQAAVS
ncbi:hypothetical protein [Caballeronia sp. LZ035]|uniref:hypothetical protein n=1 Tax=Caballeronia sp. LZ035 TaxID=3038568 RepID=UPI0028633FA9|nr:hypothetical protein [Caballeronia sp. LZ035]MDR5755469.1 hypothetical protein [Caballeronia sp. LZ035]